MRTRAASVLISLCACLFLMLAPAFAADWPFRWKAEPGAPNSLVQIARSIDSVEDKILDDGVVVIKQPDVWGQARMTVYRKDVETQLKNVMDNPKYFDFILSARIARVDEASFMSQTALGASLTGLDRRGRNGGTAASAASTPTVIALPSAADVFKERDAQQKTADDLLKTAQPDNTISRSSPFAFLPGKAPFSNIGQQGGYLGVEPPVFLDEKKRFLDHLNELRRVNLGDDNADSAGYGLYLLRLPVSIQPGELTLKGHGAVVTATIRHDFGPDYLKQTFRDLAINDVVDQIGPVVYELIRSGVIEKLDTDVADLDQSRKDYMTTRLNLPGLAEEMARKKADADRLKLQLKTSGKRLIATRNELVDAIVEAFQSKVTLLASEVQSQAKGEKRSAEPFVQASRALTSDQWQDLEAATVTDASSLQNAGELIARSEGLEDWLSKLPSTGDTALEPLKASLSRMIESQKRVAATSREGRQLLNEIGPEQLQRARALTEMVEASGQAASPSSWIANTVAKSYQKAGRPLPPPATAKADVPPAVRDALRAREFVSKDSASLPRVLTIDPALSERAVRYFEGIEADAGALKQKKDAIDTQADTMARQAVALKKQADDPAVKAVIRRSVRPSVQALLTEKKSDLDFEVALEQVLDEFGKNLTDEQREAFRAQVVDARTELASMQEDIDTVTDASQKAQDAYTKASESVTQSSGALTTQGETISKAQLAISLERMASSSYPSTRFGVRVYPIAPSDFDDVFITDNLVALARNTRNALTTDIPRATDVRNYIRHELEEAYRLLPHYEAWVGPVNEAIKARDFRRLRYELYPKLAASLPGDLQGQPQRPLTVLCWCYAIEAGLLDLQLKDDMARTQGLRGFACPDPTGLLFYTQMPPPEAEQVFEQYVRARWPMITFSLDPFVDQQNIADAFSQRRDLQLALAYAFAAGRISFNQLDRFNRRLELDAETIALNRTVTSFAHADDTFGWRFYPRYQNPPQEKSNFQVLTNQLIRGGPGRNYQMQNSKLEAGQRELTAVVIMPAFLQRARVEVTGNWFPLHDPDEMEIPTARMIEQGRQVVELRQSLGTAAECAHYRPGDIERLNTRIDQLEAMLPMQTRQIKVPYENTLGGSQLFTPGASALVPELLGFEGIDQVDPEKGADILVYGKHISIHETKVIVGGKFLAAEGVDKDAVVDIVSREVIRLKIPAGTFPSLIRNAPHPQLAKDPAFKPTPYLEVFVSTPNGISNRLLIPVKPAAAKAATAAATPATPAAAAYILLDDRLPVRAHVAPTDDKKVFEVKPLPVAKGAQIRLQPVTPPAKPTDTIQVDFHFPVERDIQVVVTADKVPFKAGAFVIDEDTLNSAIVSDLIKKLNDYNKLTRRGSPTHLTSRNVVVSVAGASGPPKTTFNPLTVSIELHLGTKAPSSAPKPATTTTTTKSTGPVSTTTTTAPVTTPAPAAAASPPAAAGPVKATMRGASGGATSDRAVAPPGLEKRDGDVLRAGAATDNPAVGAPAARQDPPALPDPRTRQARKVRILGIR